jgi:hypothetical protein
MIGRDVPLDADLADSASCVTRRTHYLVALQREND